MTLKPCLECGELAERTRCPDHQIASKPNARELGYDWHWEKLSRKARRLQPFCTDCGALDDLQADHSPEAWHRHERGLKVRLEDIEVVCGDCNRRRGAARRWGGEVAQGVAVSEGKARSATHTPRGIR